MISIYGSFDIKHRHTSPMLAKMCSHNMPVLDELRVKMCSVAMLKRSDQAD